LRKLDRGSTSLFLAISLCLVIQMGWPSLAMALRRGAQDALAPDVVVALQPARQVVEPGASFTVSVAIEGVSDLGAYEFTLVYDPALVEVVEIEDAGFLESSGRTAIPTPVQTVEPGVVTFGAASIGDALGPEGSGDLAVVTMEASGIGTTDLILEDVKILNPAVMQIALGEVQDGQVQVGEATPTPTPDRSPTTTAVLDETPTASAVPPTAAPTSTAEPNETEVPTVAPAGTATPMPGPTDSASATPTAGVVATATPQTTATLTPTPTPTSMATDPGGDSSMTPTLVGTPTSDGTPTEPSPTVLPATSTTAGVPVGSVTPTLVRPVSGPEQSTPDWARWRLWLIVLATLLGVLGIVIIGAGVLFFGSRASWREGEREAGGPS
jgi:hypothetical protein